MGWTLVEFYSQPLDFVLDLLEKLTEEDANRFSHK